jgi:hypothetical protein
MRALGLARWLALTALPVLGACAADDGGGSAMPGGDAAFTAGPVDVGRLAGLDSTQVASLLGPADFRRADGPAEVLQYRGTGCVLDIYLYRDDAGAGYRVTYVEARDRQAARTAPQPCLSSVLQARRAAAAG